MKPVFVLGLFLHCLPLLGYDVRIRVVDDRGIAVVGASATIDFIGYIQGSGKSYKGTTNEEGMFSASGRAEHSVFVVAKKDGYYEARVDRLPKDRDLDLIVEIPRILHPIPLYARRAIPAIPVQNEWLGYDLEVADWVAPLGKGRVVDIQFKFSNEFKGWRVSGKQREHSRLVNSRMSEKEFKDFYGKWDAKLEISFPDKGEGLHEETHFVAYTQLKLPHAAPEDDYVPTWHYTSNNYSPPTTRHNVGFFLRTRVKLDKAGKIVSANYAKLIGDIFVASAGGLRFTYYFNPTPNDRNLEFDSRRNLFPDGMFGTTANGP